MSNQSEFVDIHCHLLPGIDDGSESIAESIQMARIAESEGITTITVTPHQLGAYRKNTGQVIREKLQTIQKTLQENEIGIKLLPGGDVRIEADLVDRLKDGSVLTLGDHGKHVLLELPHETYFPLEPLLEQLQQIGLTGILSHPERNQGLLADPALVERLVDCGCLMQITAGSLLGTFGVAPQRMASSLMKSHVVHFVATDAHGCKRRRPLLQKAFEKSNQLVGKSISHLLFCEYPANVANGRDVPSGRLAVRRTRWMRWAKAG